MANQKNKEQENEVKDTYFHTHTDEEIANGIADRGQPVVNSAPIGDDEGGAIINEVVQPDEIKPKKEDKDAPVQVGVVKDIPKVNVPAEPVNDTVADAPAVDIIEVVNEPVVEEPVETVTPAPTEPAS